MPGGFPAPAPFNKMPEHPVTCYRVKVCITSKRIVNDRSITVVKDTNSPGKPVSKPGFPGGVPTSE